MPAFQVSNLKSAISAAEARGAGLLFIGNRVYVIPESQINLRGLDPLALDNALEVSGDPLVSFANLAGVRAK